MADVAGTERIEGAVGRRRLAPSGRAAFLLVVVLALLAVPLLYPVLVPYSYVLLFVILIIRPQGLFGRAETV